MSAAAACILLAFNGGLALGAALHGAGWAVAFVGIVLSLLALAIFRINKLEQGP